MTLCLNIASRHFGESRKDYLLREFEMAKKKASENDCEVIIKGFLYKSEIRFLIALSCTKPTKCNETDIGRGLYYINLPVYK